MVGVNDNNINCSQELKKQEKTFKDEMKDFMKETNLFNYEKTKDRINKNISGLQKLKDNEKTFKDEMNDFMKETNLFNSGEGAEKQLTNIKNKVDNMDNVLNRKDVVITIFGSVSVGKSCFMNALLHDKIFRSAASHTTLCCIEVTKGNDNCLMYRDKKESFNNVGDMKKKINELSSRTRNNNENLQDNEVLRILIKETSSSILKNNVVIVDTPGADRNTNIHDIIKDRSQDSDIFIFMLNSNITDVDRGFFDYQTETSIRPDIFILINKWDQYDDDDDEDTEDSKLDIIEECSGFIRKQKGGNEKDIKSQIYFISAKETLAIRTNPEEYQNLTSEQQQRKAEFVKFEEKLQNYINNPMENRLRRYKNDIKKLETDMAPIIEKFQNYFKRKLKISIHILDNLNRLIDDIENIKKELIKIMENGIRKIKFSALFSSGDVNDISNALKGCIDRINEMFIELDKKCERKVLNFFENVEITHGMSEGTLKRFSKIGSGMIESGMIGSGIQLSVRNTRPINLNLVYQSLSSVDLECDSFVDFALKSLLVGTLSVFNAVFQTAEAMEADISNRAALCRTVVQLKAGMDATKKEIYNRYENYLNEICEYIKKSKKYWKDYNFVLNEIKSGLD